VPDSPDLARHATGAIRRALPPAAGASTAPSAPQDQQDQRPADGARSARNRPAPPSSWDGAELRRSEAAAATEDADDEQDDQHDDDDPEDRSDREGDDHSELLTSWNALRAIPASHAAVSTVGQAAGLIGLERPGHRPGPAALLRRVLKRPCPVRRRQPAAYCAATRAR